METILITNITVVNYDQQFFGDVYIKDGRIEKIGQNLQEDVSKKIDGIGKEWILFPGFIDMHIHGSAGFDVMDATKEALSGMANSLVMEGTTSFLATTMTQSPSSIEAALTNISSFENGTSGAELVGIHIEGPYISKKRAGAQPVEYIIEPSIEQLNHWQQLSGQRIKQITVAPEVVNGFEFVETISKQGIIVSIGHSDATAAEVEKAVKLGATQATHLFNQMSPFHHREPGVVGSVLIADKISTEIIVDFIHSHRDAVQMAYRLKGASKTILITDAMRAKGLAEGEYELGGQAVRVTKQGAHLSDGTLAGSVLTMDQAVRNMWRVTDCSLQELVAMSSANAAKQLNLPKKGYIANGFDADIVILDKGLNIQKTICRGNIVFERQ